MNKVQEISRKMLTLLILLCLSFPLIGAGVVNAEGLTPQDEGVFVMAISYMPDSLSPSSGGSDDYTSMIRPIHDPLFFPTKDGYIPRLAEKLDISEDALTYTVHLHPDAVWSDGTPITTDDILFTIDYSRHRGKGVSSYEHINNEPIEITVIDEKTIEFVLPMPYSYYLRRLGGMTIYPSHEFDNDPEKLESTISTYYNSTDMVNSGAFKVEAINPDSIVLKARDDYYRGTPQVKTIILRTVGSGSSRNIALENGEISYMRITTAEDLAKYSDHEDYNIVSVSEDRTNYLQINPYGPQAELLSNPDARKAIMYAINLEEIIAIAYGDEALADPAKSMVNPGLFFHDPDVENYPFDLEEAKKLAESSGLKGQTLVYVFNRDRANMEQVATVVQQQLQQIGVNLVVEGLDSSTFFPRFFALSFNSGQEDSWDLGSNGWDSERGMNGGQTFSYFNHSKRAWGYSEEVAEMAVAAHSATTPEEGKEIYKEVQEKAMAEYWIHPLTYTNFIMVSQKNVEGLDTTLVPEFTDWLAIEVH